MKADKENPWKSAFENQRHQRAIFLALLSG